jgi:hypothetical protein
MENSINKGKEHMNERWTETFGETARRLAQSAISNLELGKVLNVMYMRMEEESMRDAREEVNQAQTK